MKRRNHGWRWIVLGFAGVVFAFGQEMVLRPERYAVTPGATLSIRAGSRFGSAAESLSPATPLVMPEAVVSITGLLNSAPVTLSSAGIAGSELRWNATLPRPGIASFALRLKPETVELNPLAVERYFRTIHVGDEVRAIWRTRPALKGWRELRAFNVTTFVRVGEPPAADDGWSKPLGGGLQLVPHRDPTALRLDERLRVRLMRGTEPITDVAVAFVSAGESREHVVLADDNGFAEAVLDLRGEWLIRATVLRRDAAGGHDWSSESTTLSVEVK
jgi:hypothetical protein